MAQSPESGEEQVFDASPYLKLFIDKDGRWFQNGAEIIHPEIYRTFNEMLFKAADGGYQVRMGREICRVEVEDAPFVVKRVEENGEGGIFIDLNDGTREPFEPRGFWIGAANVPYCRVKGSAFHARFSRPAYYQLARHIVTDEKGKQFFLMVNGERIAVAVGEGGE